MLKQRLNDDNDSDGDEFIQNNCLVPFRKRSVSQQYTFVLDEDIQSPAVYRNLILACVESSENDQIRLIVNSNGGQLDSCLSICDNLKETAADTLCIISGNCHSAASAIALACQKVAVLPSSSMNLHNARYGSYGKAVDVETHVEFNKKQLRKFIESTYKGFLTQTEMESVIQGREMYLDSDEIVERLKSRQALQEKEMQADLKRLNKEQKAIEAEIARRSAPVQPKPTKKAPKKPKVASKVKKASASAFMPENAAEALV